MNNPDKMWMEVWLCFWLNHSGRGGWRDPTESHTVKKPFGHFKSSSLEILNDFIIKTNRFT